MGDNITKTTIIFCRSLQEVQLDTKIRLLDSPGLALASSSDPHAALKNSVLSTDSIQPAEMIIARANKEQLMDIYLLPAFDNPTEFLLALAKRYGRYKRGGVADLNAAAKILIDDWNRYVDFKLHITYTVTVINASL